MTRLGAVENVGNHSALYCRRCSLLPRLSESLPANLAEHGLIVDDADVTSQIISQYWDPMWENGGPTSISGYQTSVCELD